MAEQRALTSRPLPMPTRSTARAHVIVNPARRDAPIANVRQTAFRGFEEVRHGKKAARLWQLDLRLLQFPIAADGPPRRLRTFRGPSDRTPRPSLFFITFSALALAHGLPRLAH